METLMSHIPIVYCFDRGYVDPTAVSTYSVFKTSNTPVKFYWICYEYAVLQAEFYRKPLEKLGIHIEIVEVDENVFNNWKKDLIVPHINKAAYLRLLIPSLIQETRAIYLDSDIISMSDLNELFTIELNETAMAGTYNFYEPSEQHIKPPILDEDTTYINSGVLVMDLEKLRSDNFLVKAERIHAEHYDKIMASDQCVINKYLENNKTLFDRKWNYMLKSGKYTEEQFKEILKTVDIALLHFTDCSKPWDVLGRNRAMSDFWWSVAYSMRSDLRSINSEIQ